MVEIKYLFKGQKLLLSSAQVFGIVVVVDVGWYDEDPITVLSYNNLRTASPKDLYRLTAAHWHGGVGEVWRMDQERLKGHVYRPTYYGT